MIIMKGKKISFSPPDITQKEIDGVVEVLKSGWITSGPKVKKFEEDIEKYCPVSKAVAVYSGTSALELALKLSNVSKDDEVITTPYTYSATASCAFPFGIKPKMVDVEKDSFLIDINKLYDAITPKTKVIITVDIAGIPVDYDKVKDVLKAKGREDIILVSDSAHSMGAKYKGKHVGSQFDFHAFSFHAVKNLTTAEGGALTFNNNKFRGCDDLYKLAKLNTLHGQSKDAFSKTKAGAWQYDILLDGFKCNMTDIQAAIGIAQLERYEGMIEKRKAIYKLYSEKLSHTDWAIIPFSKDDIRETSYHLYPLRIRGFNEEKRNAVITELAEMGIATNVHFIPLPMFTLYKKLGYSISDYPNAYNQYCNEISMPLYSILSLEDAEYVVDNLIKVVEKIRG